MQAQTLPIFSFEGTQLRVFGDAINPLFAAADVCKALNLTNATMALRALAPFEKSTVSIDVPNPQSNNPKLNLGSFKKELNVVNESGLYTLILRSRDATKEGTPAYRFRVKVTSEILPAIRRTGRYECPVSSTLTIDAAQQLAIRNAVAKRAKNVTVHYQTIYHALYDRYQIPRYTELLRSDFDDALRFIATCEIRPQLETPQSLPKDSVVLTVAEIELFRNALYRMRYLYRPELETMLKFLQISNSPLAPRFWELVHDLSLSVLEKTLEKHGFAITDMTAYKALTAR